MMKYEKRENICQEVPRNLRNRSIIISNLFFATLSIIINLFVQVPDGPTSSHIPLTPLLFPFFYAMESKFPK